ncbi:MAG: cache domain-containing protein, partial [Thiotrichaceae bacterium]|nr:cache domain-containing protein [Thiotrichaceae bacterium]
MTSLLTFLNLKTRLTLIVSLSILGLLFLGIINLYGEQKQFREEKELKTRHVVETAHTLVNFFYQKSKSGQMTEATAQKMAMEAVKQLRYEEKEYFWINNYQPKMIMHPYKPQLDGKDLSSVKDPSGKFLFNEMVDIVTKNGSGYVSYLWPKPGMDKDKPVEKISFVKGFEPWQWIIGSGIYVDDLETLFYQHLKETLIWVGILSLVIVILSLLIVTSITSPLRKMQQIFSQVEQSGDLTLSVPVEGKSEITDISKAFNS